ncbi:lytic murein transglycosylase [Candidatus Parcubacteria bacterium]|nr:lytic murein transglycosylase [Candidatus Parcubacteria bacterium]
MSIKKIIILSAFLAVIPVFAYGEDLAAMCQQLSESANSCQNLSSADCQAQLKKCAAYYDEQSVQIGKDITKTAAQKNTLQNTIGGLKKKISNLEYQIKQGTLMVKDLNIQINDTQVSIDKTMEKVQNSQNEIANILRTMHQEDQKPSVQILLEGNLADFFSNLVYLENLDTRVSDLLQNTKDLGKYLQSQKEKMDSERGSLQKTIQIQNDQKKQNEVNKKEQDTYLKLTEAQYQQQIKDKAAAEKNAAAIKARIFEVVGVSAAPTFGQAVEIAKYVSNITGVRPAFLLAILTQESSLGKNVGQCYVTDFDTGNGTSLQGAPRSRVMNPKSIPTFIRLTQSLGMEPTKTPVSCWIPLYSSGVPYGWGGAMGPAQFIASTWALYENRTSQIKGSLASPWIIKDAFLASGLLLKDNGALSSESNAAARRDQYRKVRMQSLCEFSIALRKPVRS